jgi:predicted NAD/FAD-dependent oxidoreductase
VLPGVTITATRRRSKSAISSGSRVVAVRKAEFHRHVAAFGEAGFAQAFAEGRDHARAQLGRTRVDESDHRHRALLRAGGARPGDRGRRAAK